MSTALGALAVLLMLGLMGTYFFRIRTGYRFHLRKIPALDVLPKIISRAVEAGQRVHVSLGTGSLLDATSASTLAGLAVLDHLADRGCASGEPPLVTIADPMVLPAAQDSLRGGFTRHGRAKAFRNSQVEMIAPQPTIYAMGASNHLHSERTAANVMIGRFGPEALLLAEPGAQRGITQLAGTDDPQAMAMLMAAADESIIGEEIYAVPAYLSHKPAHLASLKAQDIMRIVIVALILILTLLRTAGIM